MFEKLKQKKTIATLVVIVVAVAYYVAVGRMSVSQGVLAGLVVLAAAFKKVGENRIEDILSEIASHAKKAAPVFLVSLALLSGCACSRVHSRIVELRRLHANWREATQPKPGVDPAVVEHIGASLDRTMQNLEELTR